jgi:hypothetical protein
MMQYWIAFDPGLYTGEVETGSLITTDQRNLEVYEDKAEYDARLAELEAEGWGNA